MIFHCQAILNTNKGYDKIVEYLSLRCNEIKPLQ